MKKNTISCLLLILLAAAACFTLSCSSGVDVTEADLVLDSFGIVWPAGFDETCVSGVGMTVTINAYDQNGAVFDWSGAVNIVTTNTDVSANPATVNLQNGTVQTTLRLISDTGEDLSTSLQITGGTITTDLGITIAVQVVLPLYNLTVSSDGHGTVSPSGTVQAAQGDPITVTDTPDTGWVFMSWTVESGDATLGSASEATTTVTLTSGDATVMANHDPGPEINLKMEDTNIESGGRVDFEYLLIGEEREITFTIENTGQMDLELTGDPAVSVTGSGDISVTAEPSSTITSGSETTFKLTIAPESNLEYEETVTILTNDDDEDEYTITVTGAGVQMLAETPDDSGANFGKSVHMNGDYLIVGAPDGDTGNADEGAAYVYAWDGEVWNLQAELWASDWGEFDNFGWSVAISEDYAVVGAKEADEDPVENPNTGAVYIYDWSEDAWGDAVADHFEETHRITADDADEDDDFGTAVGLYGNRIAVGASMDDDGESAAGSVYVYKLDEGEWVEEDKVTLDVPSMSNYFGKSVSLYDDYLIVGSYDGTTTYQGAAYIFKWDDEAWTQQAKLMADERADYDYFGDSVAIQGDCAFAGAPGHASAAGAAYAFFREGTEWGTGETELTEDVMITAEDGEANDKFGMSIAVRGDYALIGAFEDDDNEDLAGSVYVLGRDEGGTDNWGQITKILAPDLDPSFTEESRFGNAVSIGENHFAVGAFNYTVDTSQEGVVYVFPY